MYTSMFRKAMLGDTALLALDFTTGTMPSAVTFTRADSTARATYIDASGYVKTVTAAGDPRFDYTGGVAKGLLVEAAATNLCRRTSDFADVTTVSDGTQWAGSGYNFATLSTTLPDGSTGSARRIIDISSGAGSMRSTGETVVASTVYTWSFWARNNGGSQARYRVWNANAGSSIVDYTLSGSNYVSQIGGANNTSSTWVRVSVTFTTPVGCTTLYVYPCSTDSGTVDLLVWGAQLELGSSASSYISTTSAQRTRLADDAVIRSTAWTSLYAQPGAMVVEFYRGAYGAGDRSIMSTDPTAARHWHLKNANASATAQIAFSTGSPVTQTGLTAGLNKVAIAWNAPTPTASFDLCVNGATPTFGGSNVGTTLSTWLTLGSQSTTGVSGSGTWDGYLNNSIKSVKYYTGLTYAEMQAKTT
tara:strand:- start:4548 stop:5798 length:1251 start_codon:yes stop_codon:yes gene_type:complete